MKQQTIENSHIQNGGIEVRTPIMTSNTYNFDISIT
jgi:hypothetical protein